MSAAELAGILRGAQAGDLEAWGQIYKSYAPAVFRFCRRVMPTREDAEDATSEIFMKVRTKIGQYDSSRPFSAWLYKVATNHCWDMLRRRRVRQDLESPTEIETMPLEHPAPGQLEQLMTERTGEEVRGAMEKLPARARMALAMRYYADMSYEEIADSLCVRKAFVGVLLLRARHELRHVLEGRRGQTTGAGAGGML
jgi:RNA polymerase sigma factor (sigma-70 family)